MATEKLARKIPCLALALFLATGTLGAQHAPRTTVSGSEVKERTEELLKVYNWSSSLDDLKSRAESENKLMFWIQIVGNLGGGL